MAQGNPWKLLLDDYHLARTTGLDRMVHHPRAHGLVLRADQPWETGGVAPSCITRRPAGSFVCFYNAMYWDLDAGRAIAKPSLRQDRAHHRFARLAYATSADGIHWEKPDLGLLDGPAGVDWQRNAPYPSPAGSTRHNNLGVPFVVIQDLRLYGNVQDPAKRWVLRLAPQQKEAADIASTVWLEPRGYFAAELPDFIHEPHWRDKLTDTGSTLDPRRNLLSYWDDIHQEWVAIEQGVWPHWIPSREIGRFASKDLVHWTSQAVLYPDALDPHTAERYDEPMALTPFCAEGVVMGLLSWFHSDRAHPDAGPNWTETPEHPVIWPWCRKGTNEMRITLSRDGGLTWDRTSSREAWIPHGTEDDSYDRLVIFPLPPIAMGDEDWFYICVINGDHLITRNNAQQTPYYSDRTPRHQVALYTQKHNRYVSLRARNQQEVLISQPVTVDGAVLQLNVDATRGSVRVALAPAGPVPTYNGSTPSLAPHLLPKHLLPGYGFDDGEAVYANSVEHTVYWKAGDLQALRGQPVCVLFEMLDADLYAFRFE